MSISNEMAKYWADEDAEANDRPPQREVNVAEGELGAGYKAGTPRTPSVAEDLLRDIEAAEKAFEGEWAEEDAKGQALFDKIEALETAWSAVDPQGEGAAVKCLHLILGGAIEALKELAYASRPAG